MRSIYEQVKDLEEKCIYLEYSNANQMFLIEHKNNTIIDLEEKVEKLEELIKGIEGKKKWPK